MLEQASGAMKAIFYYLLTVASMLNVIFTE